VRCDRSRGDPPCALGPRQRSSPRDAHLRVRACACGRVVIEANKPAQYIEFDGPHTVSLEVVRAFVAFATAQSRHVIHFKPGRTRVLDARSSKTDSWTNNFDASTSETSRVRADCHARAGLTHATIQFDLAAARPSRTPGSATRARASLARARASLTGAPARRTHVRASLTRAQSSRTRARASLIRASARLTHA
jgi:hypothetical protein